ncbi:MAG: hypothetical protein [Siphoviridae sp. ctpQM7]|nr:MAG: hypothetical protein [Siphoviridae sp. ctpQM7]
MFPWQTTGVAYQKRDARKEHPFHAYTLSAMETYRAIERSRPFLSDRESLRISHVPISLREFRGGREIPWGKLTRE